MTNKNGSLGKIIITIFGFLFIFLIIALLMIGLFTSSNQKDFCIRVYPSPINEITTYATESGDTWNVEEGFIECCRAIYVNHTREKECEVFKYG